MFTVAESERHEVERAGRRNGKRGWGRGGRINYEIIDTHTHTQKKRL